MKRTCGNAALLAFAAHLLDIDVSSAASRPSSSSSLLRRSSTSRRSSCYAFVHPGAGGTAISSSSGRVRSSEGGGGSSSRIWKQRNVSARLTKRVDGSATVAPRYYVDSSSSSGSDSSPLENNEVLVYRDVNLSGGEFSFLRPHLEFNELDLQELFPTKGRAAGSSSSSQLYEEFEEVEIGHFQPSNSLNENEGEATSRSSSSNSPFFFASHQQQDHTEELDSIPLTLPPWLSLNKARFAPMKLRKLQRDLTPHLSSKEISQVVRAIYLSAGDDSKKVAGAADFCSILVNSLEMTDAPTLCAAAFHYGSLVSVRERELMDLTEEELCSVEAENECLRTAGSDAKYLCALAGSGIENFGTHAVKIALDAARLKSMETLATTVVRKNGKLGPLSSADARNLRSLLLTVNEEGDWRALAIRSAACLYRLEGLEAYRSLLSTSGGPKRRTRVVSPEESRASQEALHIYAPLAARLGMFRLKTELEDAAFRTLYPRSHAKVSALCGGENTNSVGEGMKSVLDDISHQMKRLVQEDCEFMENIENVSVTARVKEPYSVWRKMLKISRAGDGVHARSLSILDIPDAVATRVVFSARKLTPDEPDATTQRRERELCYYLSALCLQYWPEATDSRFKDYVKNPKENGYQSLHYSSRKRWRGAEWPFEVQIRSKEMHRIAEYGVAAHWSYKRNDLDGTTPTPDIPLDRTSEAYIKSVQEWSDNQARRKRRQQAYAAVVAPTTELEEPNFQDEIRRQRKRERDETLAPYLEALSGAQTDMTRENVFVFVSVQPPKGVGEESPSSSSSPSSSPPLTEGTVLSLPAGSRVLDAIRVTEKWSSTLESSGQLYDGRNSFVALCNGLRTSSLGTELLASGDVVSILPSEELVSSSKRRTSPFFQ
mmetsp:Transcript_41042/g.74000  ORF Transcript_41042/g.74000 Transcript_41042/m.74000 type:complete len:888 (+) Transcript_41042:179-2842(+)